MVLSYPSRQAIPRDDSVHRRAEGPVDLAPRIGRRRPGRIRQGRTRRPHLAEMGGLPVVGSADRRKRWATREGAGLRRTACPKEVDACEATVCRRRFTEGDKAMNVAGKAGAALALLWWAAGGYAED